MIIVFDTSRVRHFVIRTFFLFRRPLSLRFRFIDQNIYHVNNWGVGALTVGWDLGFRNETAVLTVTNNRTLMLYGKFVRLVGRVHVKL